MDYLHKLAYPELKEYLSNPNSFIENTIHKGIMYDDNMKPSKRDINVVAVAKPQSEENVNVNVNINACCHFCQREETAKETARSLIRDGVLNGLKIIWKPLLFL